MVLDMWGARAHAAGETDRALSLAKSGDLVIATSTYDCARSMCICEPLPREADGAAAENGGADGAGVGGTDGKLAQHPQASVPHPLG